MPEVKDIILSATEIDRKIRRMAYEIYESNFKEKRIVIAGITGQGYKLAQSLAMELQNISEIQPVLLELLLDKDNPHHSDVDLVGDLQQAKNLSVVVVDDVLNTGRTLIYGFKPFLDMKVKKIEVAVLVDRSHGKFPVKANFTGIGLYTTLNDHITVDLENNKEVYLT